MFTVGVVLLGWEEIWWKRGRFMYGVVAYVVVSLLLVSGFGGVCGTAEGFTDVIIPNANI